MIKEEKQSWFAVATTTTIAILYFAGVVYLSGVNFETPDVYEWRDFITYLIIFAVVINAFAFMWFDYALENNNKTDERIKSADIESTRYAYYAAVFGLISCIAWFYSPELLNIPIQAIVHILMALLVVVLLVKNGVNIILLRK